MHGSSERLSDREQQVMRLLAGGLETKEIARRLDPPCKTETVKTHVRTIYAKLGVANRAEATAWWLRHGGG